MNRIAIEENSNGNFEITVEVGDDLREGVKPTFAEAMHCAQSTWDRMHGVPFQSGPAKTAQPCCCNFPMQVKINHKTGKKFWACQRSAMLGHTRPLK
jgi:hypothetical protein